MKVLVLGNDGYIGFPLTLELLKQNHEVFGVDNGSRRTRVSLVKSDSLTPIQGLNTRKWYIKSRYPNFVDQVYINLGFDSPGYIRSVLGSFLPDCIVHLAEMPSAPWSMVDVEQARVTQLENTIGTLDLLWAMKEECPNAHLVKLGTMGEYGTPKCDIPEGEIPQGCLAEYGGYYPSDSDNFHKYGCPMESLPFPRSPGSFYHLSKVHDTHNIIFACHNWGLSSTDIMQGVVFGLGYEEPKQPEEELTRFDYDEYFGTAINRFCAQAIINHPLTVYGQGDQTRGFLPLKDSLQCLMLAIKNPPSPGEYRTFNQFENIYTINQLAEMVCESAEVFDLSPSIEHISNPRNEQEEHYYNPTHEKLLNLGYKPTKNIQKELTILIRQLLPFKSRVKEEVILPKTNWR